MGIRLRALEEHRTIESFLTLICQGDRVFDTKSADTDEVMYL